MTDTETELKKPVIRLTCCCCGEITRGRQWWNRDTGFGLCDGCHVINGVDRLDKGSLAESFGIRGIHWDVEETKATEQSDET